MMARGGDGRQTPLMQLQAVTTPNHNDGGGNAVAAADTHQPSPKLYVHYNGLDENDNDDHSSRGATLPPKQPQATSTHNHDDNGGGSDAGGTSVATSFV